MYYYICKCSEKCWVFLMCLWSLKKLYMLKWIEIFNVIFNDFLRLKSLREMYTGFFCGHYQYNPVMCRVIFFLGLYNTFIQGSSYKLYNMHSVSSKSPLYKNDKSGNTKLPIGISILI